jgi:hypothetical protein
MHTNRDVDTTVAQFRFHMMSTILTCKDMYPTPEAAILACRQAGLNALAAGEVYEAAVLVGTAVVIGAMLGDEAMARAISTAETEEEGMVAFRAGLERGLDEACRGVREKLARVQSAPETNAPRAQGVN